MEFFGITLYGPQNYIKDMMRDEFQEPMGKEDVKPLVQKVKLYSTLPEKEAVPFLNAVEHEIKALRALHVKNISVHNGKIATIYDIDRLDVDIIRLIDCYLGRVNGFAYGSMERFVKMKRKGVIKPVGPCDMFRLPPTTSIEYGWWQHDPILQNVAWYKTHPRHPQPASPNTLILDKARKNNKYASLF